MGLQRFFKKITPLAAGLALFAGPAPGQPESASGGRPEAALEDVPEEAYGESRKNPVNLLSWQMDIEVFRRDENGPWQPVDPAAEDGPAWSRLFNQTGGAPVELPSGATDIAVKFKEPLVVDRLKMLSGGAAGRVSISQANALAPPDAKRWNRLGEPLEFSAGEAAETRFLPSEGQFVRLAFEVDEPGAVQAARMTGALTVGDVRREIPDYDEWPAKRANDKWTTFDFAAQTAGGRITHVSEGRLLDAVNINDEELNTTYTFPEPKEENESFYFLTELNSQYPVAQAILNMAPNSGRMRLFAFSEIPDTIRATESAGEGRLGRLEVSEAFAEEHRPAAVIEADEPENVLQAEFEETLARYFLVEWTPKPPEERSEPLRLVVRNFSLIGEIPREFGRFRGMGAGARASPVGGGGGVRPGGGGAGGTPPRQPPASP